MPSVLLWKEEPVSPLSTEEVSQFDDSFYQTSLDDDIKLENDTLDFCESKAEVASYILEHLENLVDLDELIKAEPSSFLLDEKILPLLDEVDSPRGAVAVPVPLKPEYYKQPEENPYFINELEKVYYELNHGTLTPPQSPPRDATIIANLEPIVGATYHQIPAKEAIYSVPEKELTSEAFAFASMTVQPTVEISADSYASMPTPQPDIAHELAYVDELVRTRVEDMQCSSGPSSPDSSSNSNFGDCSSDDPEWVPEPIENYDTPYGFVTKTPRKRSKPYSTSPDDKKSRKKEQNKNAATRYRLKKKAEVEVILNEEKGLLDKHGELNNQITDLQREIKYLKGLMRDLLKAKGVIN